jgi:hypothetical protein
MELVLLLRVSQFCLSSKVKSSESRLKEVNELEFDNVEKRKKWLFLTSYKGLDVTEE